MPRHCCATSTLQQDKKGRNIGGGRDSYVLGVDAGGLEELVHGLKQDHLGLLKGRVPGQLHGLLDDA